MNVFKLILLEASLFCCLFFSNGLSIAQENLKPFEVSDEIKAVVRSNNLFAYKLYKQLSETKGNLFCSPYSISSGLSLIYAGAKGDTADEIANVINPNLREVEFHSAMGLLNKYLNCSIDGRNTFKVCNRIWPHERAELRKPFTSLLKTHYNTSVEPLDFTANAQSQKVINQWIEKHTDSKIKDAIGSINPSTRLLLTNAVYFKGYWDKYFENERTREMPFHQSVSESCAIENDG